MTFDEWWQKRWADTPSMDPYRSCFEACWYDAETNSQVKIERLEAENKKLREDAAWQKGYSSGRARLSP